MEDEIKAAASEPTPPAAKPEESEMPDEELDETAGGMQNYWKVLTDTLHAGSDVQKKISGNLR